jgi:membrane protein
LGTARKTHARTLVARSVARDHASRERDARAGSLTPVEVEPAPPLRERAREAFEARRSNPSVELAFMAVRRDMQAGGELLAGALAMRLFILLLPFVAALLAAHGLVTRSDPETARDTLESAGIAAAAADSLSTSARISSHSLWAVLGGALVALLFAGRTTLRVLWTVHVLAWRERPRKPTRPVSGAVAIILALLLQMGILLVLPAMRHALGPALGLLGLAIGLILEVTFWLSVAWLLPHRDAPWQALIPEAALCAVGMTLLHAVTTLWAATVISHYNAAYGALGTAVALLLWFYALGRIIVAGAMLSAERWERQAPGDAPS